MDLTEHENERGHDWKFDLRTEHFQLSMSRTIVQGSAAQLLIAGERTKLIRAWTHFRKVLVNDLCASIRLSIIEAEWSCDYNSLGTLLRKMLITKKNVCQKSQIEIRICDRGGQSISTDSVNSMDCINYPLWEELLVTFKLFSWGFNDDFHYRETGSRRMAISMRWIHPIIDIEVAVWVELLHRHLHMLSDEEIRCVSSNLAGRHDPDAPHRNRTWSLLSWFTGTCCRLCD